MSKETSLLNDYLSLPKLVGKICTNQNIKAKKLTYGNEKNQYLLIANPIKRIHSSLIVYIHGGGWQSGSPRSFSGISNYFSKLGFLSISIGYRKAPKYKFPSQSKDVLRGLEKALSYFQENNIRVEDIIVIGSSAGAQLGALMCLDFKIPNIKIKGFASLAGVLSFDECSNSKQMVSYIKGLIEDDRDYYKANPYSHLKGNEPFSLLCIHGERDPLVSLEGAKKLFNKFSPLDGVSKEFIIAQGQYHSEVAMGPFYYENQESDSLKTWLIGLEKKH